MIFPLCSSASQLNIMCIWLSFQTEEALFNALRVIFYVMHNRLLVNGQWFIVSYDSASKQEHYKSNRMQ